MDEELPGLEQIDPMLAQELQEKMGRNLLRFHLIEHTLKGLLPFMHPDGQAKGDDAYLELQKVLRNQTLGEVKKYLKASICTDKVQDQSHFETYIDEVIRSRNNLIHHFLDVEGVNLGTNEGYRHGIQFLDEQFQFAESFFKFVAALATSLDEIMNPNDPLFAQNTLH
jgi:hypothetical protein